MMLNVVFKSGTVMLSEITDDEFIALNTNLSKGRVKSEDRWFASDLGPAFDLYEVAGIAPAYDLNEDAEDAEEVEEEEEENAG